MAKGKKKKELTIEEKLEQALVPREEWPYEVPENWCWVRLGSVMSVVTGKKDANYGTENGKYIFFTCAGEPINCDDYSFEGESLLLPGNGANVGKVFYFDGKFEAYQRTYVLQSKYKDLCLKYLYYQMQGFWEDFNKDKQYGSATNYIKMSNFTDYIFPLPPLAEQYRIVNQIESLFSKLDEAKEKLESIVIESVDKKEAILTAALSGLLTKCSHEVENKGIVFFLKHEKNAIKAGPFGSALKKEIYVENGYKVYGQEQVINGDETIGNYYIDERKYKELESCKVSPNDVLISLVGTVGKVLVLSEDCKAGIINPRLIKLSLDKEKMLPSFFKYYFESRYLRSMYKNKSHGTTMDVLNMKIIKDLPFPCYSIEEQIDILQILDTTLPIIENMKVIAVDAKEKIDIMKKSILSKAFRGELGTNDLEKEESIKLIRKILAENC